MMTFLELIVRFMLAIFLLTIMTKITGSKQIAQMTFYDYISGVVVGTLAGELTINSKVPILYGAAATILFFLHSVLISFCSRKSIRFRRFFVGKPVFLISQGEIQYDGLKRAKLDLNVLLSQLRMQGYFAINDVNYAILEPEGTVSIMPKDAARQLRASDLEVPPKDDSLPINVVIDGKIMCTNLSAYNKDEEWLLKTLKEKGFPDVHRLTLVTLNGEGTVYVYEKQFNGTNRSSLM